MVPKDSKNDKRVVFTLDEKHEDAYLINIGLRRIRALEQKIAAHIEIVDKLQQEVHQHETSILSLVKLKRRISEKLARLGHVFAESG